jgi:predicted dehydrogenase
MNTNPKSLRFAVVGAGRGKTFINAAKSSNVGIKLVAICDQNEDALKVWSEEPGVRLYTDFSKLLNDKDVDAICIATPVPLHARQAIAALDAGKHVLSEVTACFTIEEGWDLISAVERTGLTYMMAENYCYIAAVMQVQNMVDQGVFGELTYASGSYIHDCRNLFFNAQGGLTWRGDLRHNVIACTYPTHSLGPVARWLGINRNDFLVSTATWQSKSRATADYAKRNFPENSEYKSDAFWPHPDTSTTSIQTRNGALIDIRLDFASARPHQMMRYELQGTKAAFALPDAIGAPHIDPLIWIQDRSPTNPKGIAKEWEPLSKYREEFEHPLWKEHRERAENAGHGGGDYFILREFASAIAENRFPLIDVYDAVTWSSITPLSKLSIEKGNAPVPVPNFKGPRPK